MKKNIFTYIALSLLLFVSCSDDKEDVTWEIKESKVTFMPDGGEGYIKVEGIGAPLKAEGDKEWFSVSIENERVIVKATTNLQSLDRAGSIKVSSGATYSIISVYQKGYVLHIGEDEDFSIPMSGGTFEIPLWSGYEIEDLKLSAFLKDDSDSELTCNVENNNFLHIQAPPYKFQKPKETMIYIKGQLGEVSTVIDSLLVVNTFRYEELLGEWDATFNNGSKTISQKIELNNENKLTGFAVKEGSTAMVELPIKYNSKSEILSIVMGEYLLDYEDKYIFINPRTTGSSWSFWRPGGGPEAYNGYLTINNKAEIVISFPNFKYGSSEIGGFTFRTYPSLETSSGSTESTRSVLSLKLTRKL